MSRLTDFLYFISHGYSAERTFNINDYFSANDDEPSELSEPRKPYGNEMSNATFAEMLKSSTKAASINVINLMENLIVVLRSTLFAINSSNRLPPLRRITGQ